MINKQVVMIMLNCGINHAKYARTLNFLSIKDITMPTPCYSSTQCQTQGNITAGAFTADSVGNIYVRGHKDQILVQN